MESTVYKVQTSITIYFPKMGRQISVPTQVDPLQDTMDNYCTSIHIKENMCNKSSRNIVGNIAGNTLDLSIISKDGLLLPLNEESVFYGHMNDTAYIDITCTIDDGDVFPTISMGRYYVDTWEGGTSASTSNEVSISAVDLMSRIKNISLKRLHINNKIALDQFIDNIRLVLNNQLPPYMQIGKFAQSYGIFRDFPYAWQMYFNSIDLDDVEVIFNRIVNDTISYLWIDRNNKLHADPLLTKESSITALWDLRGSTNLLNYGTQTGDIDQYSGVRMNYIKSISHNNKQLLKLEDIQLYKNNRFEDIKLNSSNVFDIHTIVIECEEGSAYSTEVYWYKDSISFEVISQQATKATITIYGDVIEENIETIEQYKDNNNKNTILEIDNKIVRYEMIPTIVDGLINLMSMKNSQIYVEGFINPRIALGDYVEIHGSNMKLNGIYKVLSMDMTLGINYKCKASLIKVIETPRDIEDILAVHNDLLLKAMSDINVLASEYTDITANENNLCLSDEEFNQAISHLQYVIDHNS